MMDEVSERSYIYIGMQVMVMDDTAMDGWMQVMVMNECIAGCIRSLWMKLVVDMWMQVMMIGWS